VDQLTLQNAVNLTRATWSLTFATWGLVVAAFAGMIFTFVQLRIERRWRSGEHLARFRDLFEGQTLSRLRSSLAKDRLDQIQRGIAMDYENAPAASWRVLDFFESVCCEVDEKRLSLEDVWNEFGEWIFLYEHDFHGVIVEQRRLRGDATYYSSLNSVCSKLNKLCESKGMSKPEFSAKDVQDFYEVDAKN
jgi:hypothetical protein